VTFKVIHKPVIFIELCCCVVESAKDEEEEAAENLRLRCEVLSGEEQTLTSQLRDLDEQLTDHRRQVNSLESQHDSVQRQINLLTRNNISLSITVANSSPSVSQLNTWRVNVSVCHTTAH